MDSDVGIYYEPTGDGKITKSEAEGKCHGQFNGANLPIITSPDLFQTLYNEILQIKSNSFYYTGLLKPTALFVQIKTFFFRFL